MLCLKRQRKFLPASVDCPVQMRFSSGKDFMLEAIDVLKGVRYT